MGKVKMPWVKGKCFSPLRVGTLRPPKAKFTLKVSLGLLLTNSHEPILTHWRPQYLPADLPQWHDFAFVIVSGAPLSDPTSSTTDISTKFSGSTIYKLPNQPKQSPEWRAHTPALLDTEAAYDSGWKLTRFFTHGHLVNLFAVFLACSGQTIQALLYPRQLTVSSVLPVKLQIGVS